MHTLRLFIIINNESDSCGDISFHITFCVSKQEGMHHRRFAHFRKAIQYCTKMCTVLGDVVCVDTGTHQYKWTFVSHPPIYFCNVLKMPYVRGGVYSRHKKYLLSNSCRRLLWYVVFTTQQKRVFPLCIACSTSNMILHVPIMSKMRQPCSRIKLDQISLGIFEFNRINSTNNSCAIQIFLVRISCWKLYDSTMLCKSLKRFTTCL